MPAIIQSSIHFAQAVGLSLIALVAVVGVASCILALVARR